MRGRSVIGLAIICVCVALAFVLELSYALWPVSDAEISVSATTASFAVTFDSPGTQRVRYFDTPTLDAVQNPDLTDYTALLAQPADQIAQQEIAITNAGASPLAVLIDTRAIIDQKYVPELANDFKVAIFRREGEGEPFLLNAFDGLTLAQLDDTILSHRLDAGQTVSYHMFMWYRGYVTVRGTYAFAMFVDAVAMSDPRIIADASAFATMSASGTSIQVDDIQLPAGTGSVVTANFAGTYYGGGHQLSLAGARTMTASNGGIWSVLEGGTIRDVDLVTNVVTPSAEANFGGLVGLMNSGLVANTIVGGSVTSNGTAYQVGGVVGAHMGGTISHCTNAASLVATHERAGGIAGWSIGLIEYCRNQGQITGTGKIVGGIIGEGGRSASDFSSVLDSTNHAAITAGSGCVGGIAGVTRGDIIRCANLGTITLASGTTVWVGDMRDSDWTNANMSAAGGLVGVLAPYALAPATGGYIGYSYNEGNVNGVNNVGGLYGESYGRYVHYCYSRGTIAGTSYIGLLAGKSYFNSATFPGYLLDSYAFGSGVLVAGYESGKEANFITTNILFAGSTPANIATMVTALGTDFDFAPGATFPILKHQIF